jgi:AraC-like DNA-binding protein
VLRPRQARQTRRSLPLEEPLEVPRRRQLPGTAARPQHHAAFVDAQRHLDAGQPRHAHIEKADLRLVLEKRIPGIDAVEAGGGQPVAQALARRSSFAPKVPAPRGDSLFVDIALAPDGYSSAFLQGSTRSGAMRFKTNAEAHALVRQGVESYSSALSVVGGKELEALMRQGAPTAVCTAIYASPPYDLRVPPLPVSRLSVNLTRSHVSGGVEGERHQSYEALRYSLFFMPARMPSVWRKTSPSRHLSIYFHPDALDGADDRGGGFDNEQPVFNAQVAGIQKLTDQLAAEFEVADILKVEAADSLARLILMQFARKLRRPGAAPNPLTSTVMADLRDYILAHLPERIMVADLARETGLSPNRLTQAFGDHARQSPYQFVLGLRIDRATQLLRDSSLNLVDVANACGFTNQQHLCNAVRRHLGTTPNRYRRSHQRATRDD